jgi:lysophospholipase L1-like esterase
MMVSTLLAIFLATTTAATPWRILPLGDSITVGCGYEASPPDWSAVCDSGSGSYRAGLWAALNASSADTLFVGTSPEGGGPAWMPKEQRSHAGYGGRTIRWLRTIINATLKTTQPDAILVLAGTNDIGQGRTLDQITVDMVGLLSDLRAGAPDAHIFVGTVLNMVNSLNPIWSKDVIAVNAALGPVVESAGGVLVDLQGKTGLCSPNEGDTQRLCSQCNPGASICKTGYDRVHPTAAGYSLMAGVWASAISPFVPRPKPAAETS